MKKYFSGFGKLCCLIGVILCMGSCCCLSDVFYGPPMPPPPHHHHHHYHPPRYMRYIVNEEIIRTDEAIEGEKTVKEMNSVS